MLNGKKYYFNNSNKLEEISMPSILLAMEYIKGDTISSYFKKMILSNNNESICFNMISLLILQGLSIILTLANNNFYHNFEWNATFLIQYIQISGAKNIIRESYGLCCFYLGNDKRHRPREGKIKAF